MKKELIVKWTINAEALENVLSLLPSLAENSRNEVNCTLYEIFQSEQYPNELILHECYENEEAFNSHKNSEHYKAIVLSKIVPHLEVREITFVSKLF
ncbi:MAG TPA: antibiotic biosynthesis monooxygenase [Arachidicoccus sp.]